MKGRPQKSRARTAFTPVITGVCSYSFWHSEVTVYSKLPYPSCLLFFFFFNCNYVKTVLDWKQVTHSLFLTQIFFPSPLSKNWSVGLFWSFCPLHAAFRNHHFSGTAAPELVTCFSPPGCSAHTCIPQKSLMGYWEGGGCGRHYIFCMHVCCNKFRTAPISYQVL